MSFHQARVQKTHNGVSGCRSTPMTVWNQIIRTKKKNLHFFELAPQLISSQTGEGETRCSHLPDFPLPPDLLLTPLPGLLEHFEDEAEGRYHLSSVLTCHYENGELSGHATWLTGFLLLALFTRALCKPTGLSEDSPLALKRERFCEKRQ